MIELILMENASQQYCTGQEKIENNIIIRPLKVETLSN